MCQQGVKAVLLRQKIVKCYAKPTIGQKAIGKKILMAAGLGIEPKFPGSKPGVLPLHHPAMSKILYHTFYPTRNSTIKISAFDNRES